jgi:hypothetical protein
MPKEIIDIEILKEYVSGVMTRAEHHAKGVGEICLAIAGAIIWKADKIEVLERKGKLANALWLYKGGRRYVLSYNHVSGEIEVKDKSTQGIALASFSDETPIAEVKRFFSDL